MDTEAKVETVPLRTQLPKVIFGTSSLGNLFADVPHADKLAVVSKILEQVRTETHFLLLDGHASIQACWDVLTRSVAPILCTRGQVMSVTLSHHLVSPSSPHASSPPSPFLSQVDDDVPMFDSAGKYGAGLALEEIGLCLEELGVAPDSVLISNKLAWKRAPLLTPEPTFEPGAWVNIKNDAVQDISYQGMMDCYAEGNALLGKYEAKVVSVHDPDEYLAAATDDADRERRKGDILEAYRALAELKEAGKVVSIGVGAKDVSCIDWLCENVQLDWAMFACSITVYAHDEVAQNLLKKLGGQGVAVINSAVFNAGFLIGGGHFDYRAVTVETDPELFAWRDKFNALCEEFGVKATEACVQFSFLFPEIKSIALSTSKPSRVEGNVALASAVVPAAFWEGMKEAGLVNLSL